MTDCLLIIFVKNPVKGKVKTRLAATMGPEKALEIYLKLIDYTIAITKELPIDQVVFYSEYIEKNDDWDTTVYQKQLQAKGDLGAKMLGAFEWGFSAGYEKICIIGSDCLELTPETIIDGFQVLGDHDAVVGPTRDGGYYLLGMNKLHVNFLVTKEWGTSSVLQDTIRNINQKKLRLKLLPVLSDIDTVQDLHAVMTLLDDQT